MGLKLNVNTTIIGTDRIQIVKAIDKRGNDMLL